MTNKKMVRAGLFALAASALLVVSGCKQATETIIEKEAANKPNKVTATINGIIRDGDGALIDGVSITYVNGANVNGRAIAGASTNGEGLFELFFNNESTDAIGSGAMGSGYNIVLKKGGYTTVIVPVQVPTIEEIRSGYPNLKATEKAVFSDTTGALITVESTYDGFEASIGLGEQYMYRLDATVTGTALVKQTSTALDAVIPAEGSVITFDMGADYAPRYVTAKTDATGNFTFTNFPVFNSVDASAPWFAAAKFYIQPGTGTFKWDDTQGTHSFNFNVPKISTYPTSEGTLNLGTLIAEGELKTRVLSFSPVTYDSYGTPVERMAPDADITVVFEHAMDTTGITAKDITLTGTGAVTNYSTVGAVLTWNAEGNTLTINPAVNFAKGATVTLAFKNTFKSAVGSQIYAGVDAVVPKFYIEEGIDLLSTSWNDGNVNETEVAVSSPVTLTFNTPVLQVTGKNAPVYTLTDTVSTKVVDVVASYDTTGTIVTLTPAYALKGGTIHTLAYTVYPATGFSTAAADTGTLTFTTEKGAALAAPTLAVDSVAKTIVDGTLKYENGETAFYVSVSKNTDPTVVNSFQYKLEADNFWTDILPASVTDRGEDATSKYYSVTASALVSGEITQIRTNATNATNYDSPWSTPVSFTDTIAPLVGAVVFDGDAIPANATVDLAIAANPGNDLAARSTYVITLGGEPMIATVSGAATGATYTFVRTGPSAFTLYVVVAANATVDPTGTLTVSVTDGAGNEVDMDTVTAGLQRLSLTL